MLTPEWLAQADKLAEFVRENDRLPKKGEDSHRFLLHQRDASLGKRKYAWSTLRENYLDEHVPGWRGKPYSEWIDRVEELARVTKELGRLPRHREPMGGFLKNIQGVARGTREGTLTEEQIDVMDKYFPGWRGLSPDALWESKVLALAEVVKELGRLPKEKEPSGYFLRNQRTAASNTGLTKWTPERQAFMDEHVPGWQDTYKAKKIKVSWVDDNGDTVYAEVPESVLKRYALFT